MCVIFTIGLYWENAKEYFRDCVMYNPAIIRGMTPNEATSSPLPCHLCRGVRVHSLQHRKEQHVYWCVSLVHGCLVMVVVVGWGCRNALECMMKNSKENICIDIHNISYSIQIKCIVSYSFLWELVATLSECTTFQQFHQTIKTHFKLSIMI